MSSLFLLISAGIMFVSLFFTITPQFHILQQSSYYNLRFYDYLKTDFSKKTVFSFVFAAIIIAFGFLNPLICMILTAATCVVRVTAAILKTKNAKKKIVFTDRVKRMYLTLFIIIVINCAGFKYPLALLILATVNLIFSPFVAMLVNIINAPIENGIKQFFIDDAKKVLSSHSNLKIIGLTGSYGKTSTKYILGRILTEKYNVTITPGSFNTPMGVVRTIRENLKPESEIFVVEMGAKKLMDIKEICDIVHPTIGIITSIGPQHLNTFGSIENVVKTKFELADEVENNDGIMYLNLDNEYITKNIEENNYNFKGYSIEDKDGEVRAENVECSRQGLRFDIVKDNKRLSVSTKLLGSHNVLNILAAVSVAFDMGMSDTDIKYAVERLEPVSHRLEMKQFFNGSILIDDAYNSNPSGSIEALKVLGSFKPMKRIAVTPGLVELGSKEYECNVALGKACAENCDEIILVGIERSKPLMDGITKEEYDKSKVHVVKTFNDAAAMLRNMCDKNTAVLFENDLPDNYAR